MTQLSLRNITLTNASLPLIEEGDLHIEQGERVCIIGRNGVGKSSLLKVIKGELELDKGSLEFAKGLKIALLPQAVPDQLPGRLKEIVANKIHQEDWVKKPLIEKVLSKLQLNPDSVFNELSGGLKRLALLASILVEEPDILLLDEPTNHIDLEKTILLENILLSFRKTIIFITHDRTLLQKLANHIVEIDNGKLISWRGTYDKYLEHKATTLEAEAKANALFDKKLAQEEQWIRQGIKARRTRNEGRVRMLKKMREELAQRRKRIGNLKLVTSDPSLCGKVVFDIQNISFAYGDKVVVENFSTVIQRGEKIGIIGPNGVGKSTLINLILGEVIPTSGQVKHGTNLTVGYFDQLRLQLDDDKTIFETLAEMGDTITVGNQQKHIMSYMQDFLFTPSKANLQIKKLSGGERNRLLLAKLFSKSCNVLILDEPTNDLDIETLELLEEKLVQFKGTILLISHDRTFLNNVVTSTLVFEGQGKIGEYLGGYDDWLRQKTPDKMPSTSSLTNKIPREKDQQKLSYKETKELEELPNKIEMLEKKQQTIQLQLANPDLYKHQPEQAIALSQELMYIEQELANSYDRWTLLETKANKLHIGK